MKTFRVQFQLLTRVFLGILLASYAHAEDYRPQQGFRFHRAISKIEGLITGAKSLDEVVTVFAKDGRGWAFSLEGLAKLYDGAYPDKLTSTRKFAKRLEDGIGSYFDKIGHRKYVEELDWKTSDGKPPKDIIASLDQEIEDDRKKLETLLVKDRWIQVTAKGDLVPGTSPRAKLIQKHIDTIDWHSPNQDRLDVLKSVRKQLKKKIYEPDWDYSNLQSGVHELRRQLRWPMIWLQEVHGMIASTNRPIDGLESIKRDKSITGSPFSKLPPVSAKYPILVPKTGYFWLRKLVGDLGDVKDVGEARDEWLLQALKHSSYKELGRKSAKELADHLVTTHPKYVDPEIVLPRVEKVMTDSKLFPTLIRKLTKQVSWSKSKCTRKFEELGS